MTSACSIHVLVSSPTYSYVRPEIATYAIHTFFVHARTHVHPHLIGWQVQVSIRRIQFEKAWSTVQKMQQTDAVFEGPVIGVNRGGAIVLIEVC